MDDVNFFHDGIELVIHERPIGTHRKYIKIVSAAVVNSVNIIKDFKTNLKNNTFGGELNAYSSLAEETFEKCLEKLRLKAEKLGYDGVCNIKALTPSMSMGSAELILYGFGFVYVKDEKKSVKI